MDCYRRLITCCRWSWVVGYWLSVRLVNIFKGVGGYEKLEEKFEIMAEEDLALTEGGIVVTVLQLSLGCFRSRYLCHGRHLEADVKFNN